MNTFFTRFNTGSEMACAEPGRGCQDAVINARHFQGFAERIKPAEALVVGNAEVFFATQRLLRKKISYGDYFAIHSKILDRFHEVAAGSATTAADTNNDRINRLLARRTNDCGEADRRGGRRRYDRGCLDELAAGKRRTFAT